MRLLQFLALTIAFAQAPFFTQAALIEVNRVTFEDTCISSDKQYLATYQDIEVWQPKTPLTNSKRLEEIFELKIVNKKTRHKWILTEVEGEKSIPLTYFFTNARRNLSIKTKDSNGKVLTLHFACGKGRESKAPQINSPLKKITLNIPADYFKRLRNNLPNFVNGGYFSMPFQAKKFMSLSEIAPVCSVSRIAPSFLQSSSPPAQSIELIHESHDFELSFVGESETEWFRVTCYEASLVEDSIRNSFGFPTGRTEYYLNKVETPSSYSEEKVYQILLQAFPKEMIQIK